MKFIPFNKLVLIREIKEEEKEVDGVYIPASSNGYGKPQGEVVAFASDCVIAIKDGDKILYERPEFAVTQDGERLLVIKEENVHILIQE